MPEHIIDWARKQGARVEHHDSEPVILEFSGRAQEYDAAQKSAAFFVLDDLQTVSVAGKDAADLLHRLTMNEMRRLNPGDSVINAFPDANGRLAAVFLLKKNEAGFELIVPGRKGKVVADWIEKYTFIEEVTCELKPDVDYFLLVGPESEAVLGMSIAENHFDRLDVNGISAQAGGVEGLFPRGVLLQVAREESTAFAQALVSSDRGPTVQAAGWQAYQLLRVEACVPEVGAEITPRQNPYEAGLQRFISYTKGCFTGQEVIARLDTYDKVKYTYTGLRLETREVPELPAPVYAGEMEVGEVTSAVLARAGDEVLALGRIRKKFLDEQSGYTVQTGSGSCPLFVRSCPHEHEQK